jgi:hypothetical protein
MPSFERVRESLERITSDAASANMTRVGGSGVGNAAGTSGLTTKARRRGKMGTMGDARSTRHTEMKRSDADNCIEVYITP